MSEIARTGTVVSEEDMKERVDVGIAFLVLLFMAGLGAYLMTTDDADLSVVGLSPDTSTTVVGGESSAPVSLRDKPSATSERISDRGLYRQAEGVEPAEQLLADLPTEALASEVEVSEPSAVSPMPVEELAEPIFKPVPANEMQPKPVPEIEAQVIEVSAVEPVPAPELSATVSEEETALLQLATDSVSFVVGSAVLTQESTQILDDIAELLRSQPNSRLSVIGYTDSQGDPDENVALSFARAEACRDYLLKQGAKVGQVDSAGMGERRPIGDNATPEGRRANRRVEFALLKMGS